MKAHQEEEYKTLKLHCQFDHDKGCLMAKYSFSRDPSILVDIGPNALALQERQEKQQIKKGTHAKYMEQFKDIIAQEVISKVTPEELRAYQGPVSYITHQEVFKDSAMTPVRVVSNSSFQNGNTTLNESMISQKCTTLSRLGLWKGTSEGSGFENRIGNLGNNMPSTLYSLGIVL